MTPQRRLPSRHRLRTSALIVAGRHPIVYDTLFRLSGSYRQDNLVGKGTDVCIEGPPGSGNTYAVTAFSLANPGVKIGHHHHVRAQVSQARRLGVPTISLLRDPIDCALSRASSWGTPTEAQLVLKQWLEFFADESLIDYSLVVTFETLTSSPETMIEELNRKFETNFAETPPASKAVFEEMDKRQRERSGDGSKNPNRPDRRRVAPPVSWRTTVASLPMAAEATRRYEALANSAL